MIINQRRIEILAKHVGRIEKQSEIVEKTTERREPDCERRCI